MDIFKIKYIPDIFPNFSFEDELVLLQEVTELPVVFESYATSQKFGITYDNVRSTRIIQSIKRRAYTVKVILSRNIDIQLINLAYTTITTTVGETFVARDITITNENVSGSRNILYTINFFRYDDTEIVNKLTSDNVLAYFTETSAAVNVINFTVTNPSYSLSNVVTYRYAGLGYHDIAFDLPQTTQFSGIKEDDEFYCHTDNSTFHSITDVATDYTTRKCYVIDINNGIITFGFGWEAASTTVYNINHMVLDSEPDERGAESSMTTNTVTLNIYTHINPILSNPITTVDGLQFEDSLKENQKIISQGKAYFKFWLTRAQLYLYEMLLSAKASAVTFTTYDGTVYKPVQMGGITNPVENENLIDVYEFDCNLIYTNKHINYFR